MNKYVVRDIVAMGIAFGILVVTFFILPYFWLWYLKAFISIFFAGILFVMYIMIRPSDNVIALDTQLQNIAKYAKSIENAEYALIPEARFLKSKLDSVSREIAQLDVRILSRDFKYLSAEIHQLEEISKNFSALMDYLTGGVFLIPEARDKKLMEIENGEIPTVLKSIQALNVKIDEERVKHLETSEANLKFFQRLSERSDAAKEAAAILQTILDSKKE